nr:uncharacterized protein LOC117692673 [Crassostrea gigas]
MDVLNTFMLMFEIFITGRTQSICRPPGPDGIPVCCQYYYIAGNYCKECPTGFRVLSSDFNCTDPCDFPSYGDHCKETCSCSKEDCNHVYGCPEISRRYENGGMESSILPNY